MSTNYDFIAEQYKRAKLQPWRAHVESFTLLGVIGDLAGNRELPSQCCHSRGGLSFRRIQLHPLA